jgi:dihydrofolate synthase/folylpolyglutamate synthase
MLSDYQGSLDYLYGRLNYESVGMPRLPSELRIGRMRRLLRRLGDPQSCLRIVHVAGTKGKGSTAAMLAAALSASGVRTGLYSSPHLHRLEERFTVDTLQASREEIIALTGEVREAVEALERDERHANMRGPTFFEITTAMGLLHFARHAVGAVVLEVGLGGRLDSTNVIHPVLSIITSISLDHTRQLGNTLGAIASEKAGIFKRGRPAISGVRESEPRESIQRAAERRRCRLYEIGHDFDYVEMPPEPPLHRPTPFQVSVKTWRTEWGTLSLPLLGAHQAHNAAVCLAALDLLAECEPSLEVKRGDVIRGFESLRWPARVEVLGQNPWLVVDGAHNPAASLALAETMDSCFPRTPRTLIFGTTRDKDLPGQLRVLLPLFDKLIATRYLENPRSVPPETIALAAAELSGCPCVTTPGPLEALELARRITPDEGTICVTGSLFLAAETRALVLPQLSAEAVASSVP